MDKQYFVLEFAHAVPGQCKRIRVKYKHLAYVLAALCLLAVCALGLFSTYARMYWKASHYNELRTSFESLRSKYLELQRVSRQHTEQMASLEVLASEVSVAYGLNSPVSAGNRSVSTGADVFLPTVNESIREFNYLKAASFSGIYHRYGLPKPHQSFPSSWPIEGILRSSFGGRSDPFSGEGAFHTGIDLSAPVGTPVHASADGVVISSGWSGAYGKRVVVDHGNGLQTYYAHLSSFLVIPGQEVRRGQVIALSGSTGRATGPHIHYEVRLAGTPVNPYKYLAKIKRGDTLASSRSGRNDLGL
ncbi:MAG: peptidoglycan DD-metalloendopeptidase family protein [Bryobacteraceae bacterium]